MNIRVLIVEDEDLIRWSLRKKFETRGYLVEEAAHGQAAMEALERGPFDLIMLDYKLPDMTGLDVLRSLRERDGDAVVIMMTAYSSIESAVEAMKLGAFDYVPKPFQMEELLLTVDRALETTRLRREVRELRQQLRTEFGTDMVIGQHPSMRSLMETLQTISRSGTSTVFLRGDTGTGKDLLARVIHHSSDRTARPFVNITCTALPETLLESELFGHERGAFTDARAQKKGMLEVADGGTAFLDEIGDMPAGMQAKLLRVLEERRFRRVGGTREISVDVRIVAATNRDIQKLISEGKFREDLFYRLNVVSIEIPPLRERGEDIALLARHFVERFATEFKKRIRGVEPAAQQRLDRYQWPGNVRELRNVMERAVLLCKSDSIGPDDLALGPSEASQWPAEIDFFTLPPSGFDLNKLNELELNLLRQALARTDNNQTHTAQLLNISRDTLRYRLQKHGLLKNDRDGADRQT